MEYLLDWAVHCDLHRMCGTDSAQMAAVWCLQLCTWVWKLIYCAVLLLQGLNPGKAIAKIKQSLHKGSPV